MSAFNAHLAGATERSFSSSLSPDRVFASSEDDNAAAALDPELYKNLADKRTTRGKLLDEPSLTMLFTVLIYDIRWKSSKEARTQAQ